MILELLITSRDIFVMILELLNVGVTFALFFYYLFIWEYY